MRLLRVYDRDRLLREFNVSRPYINRHGALVCPMPDDDSLRVVMFAPGTWSHMEEYREQPAPAPQHSYPPVTLSDAGRVHEAMQILCACAQLRCPVVINAGSPEERGWWRRRQQGDQAGAAPAVAPLMQCVHEQGHPDDIRHEWREGGWPYGPHHHHPACPRHPDAYNQPSEGQPQHAAGITETPDRVRPYVVDTPDQYGAAVGRAPLALGGDPYGYSRDDVPGTLTPGSAEPPPCGAYAPGYDGRLRCSEPMNHPPGGCVATTLGGDRVRW